MLRVRLPVEVFKRQKPSAMRAGLDINVGLLANLNEYERLTLVDAPVQEAQAEPSIVDTGPDFYPVADQINYIDPITLVIRLFDMEADPELILRDLLPFKRGAGCQRYDVFDFPRLLALMDMVAKPIDMIFRRAVGERNAEPHDP
jgi:hypothetical protein